MTKSKSMIRSTFYFLTVIVILIMSIVFIKATKLPIVVKELYVFLAVCYLIYCTFTGIFWVKVISSSKEYMGSSSSNILIIAPHQDDGVAIAGGYAIQVMERGGAVDILYITDGYKDDKITRKREAIHAWSTIDIKEDSLHFLKHDTSIGLTENAEMIICIKEIRQIIEKIKPSTIFLPLYEGGNYQHDVTNYMVSQAIRHCKIKNITVYEAPEYNFYYSFRSTPEKMLSGLMRLIPFTSYDYPPEPIRNDTIVYLKMTPEQIQLKREMLLKFTTQNPDQLVKRFGFEDRFQKLHDYDYSKPPFDYDCSLAKKINFLKTFPVIGKVMSRMFKWTKTIHPDPDYLMTRIPLH